MNDSYETQDHALQLYIKASQSRFDQSFAALCFAALALSLQFSTREHSILRPVLILAWASYLVAGLLAGWRLMYTPKIDAVARGQDIVERFVARRTVELQDPQWLEYLSSGRMIDSRTGHPMTRDSAMTSFREEETKLAVITEQLRRLQTGAVWRFCIALGTFSLAVVLNGVYLSVSFLRSP